MANAVTVKPAPGMTVRNPQRGFQPLPPEGATVELDQYFIHRLRDGDVVRVAPVSDPAPPASPEPAPVKSKK